jgi:biotin transport system substrate-specific component
MTTRDIGLVALFAAVIVALGTVPALPLAFGVPITLQSLGVMLAGLILGAKRGALAPIVVIVLVGIGLPVLAGGRGGLPVYAGPTAGFLFGWVPSAFVAGWIAERFDRPENTAAVRFVGLVAAAVLGVVVVLYACGIGWLALVTGIGFSKAFFGSLAFVPGDVAKAVIAAIVTRKVGDAWALRR